MLRSIFQTYDMLCCESVASMLGVVAVPQLL